jgi:hypothetical protein
MCLLISECRQNEKRQNKKEHTKSDMRHIDSFNQNVIGESINQVIVVIGS